MPICDGEGNGGGYQMNRAQRLRADHGRHWGRGRNLDCVGNIR